MTVREPTKAVIQNLDTGEKIVVPYNPTDLTSTRSLVTCSGSGGVQFQTVSVPDFTVSLFFDTYEQGVSVRSLTDPIAALQEPSQGATAKRDPPECFFSWGGFGYKGYLTELQQHFTLFLPSGTPVRCDLTLTFTAALTSKEIIENAGLDNCRRFVVVRDGDRLDLLAHRETGLSARWRAIAAANGIDDPLRFPALADLGRTLVVPDFHS